MKGKFSLELAVGLFMIAGILCLAYLSIRLGRMEVLGGRGYQVIAVFSDIGGLRKGGAVVIAGVEVGRVASINIEDYKARVVLQIDSGVQLQDDTIASVKTRGLIGEKFIQITAGASEEMIPPGGRIRQTEPAMDIESLIAKYAFGKI